MRRLAALVLLASCGGGNDAGTDAAPPNIDAPLDGADAAPAADGGVADAALHDGAVNPTRLWLGPRTSDRDLILRETEPPPF
jgi:hypothetical protein